MCVYMYVSFSRLWFSRAYVCGEDRGSPVSRYNYCRGEGGWGYIGVVGNCARCIIAGWRLDEVRIIGTLIEVRDYSPARCRVFNMYMCA